MGRRIILKGLLMLGLLGGAASASAACPSGTNNLGTIQGKEACGLSGTYRSTRLVLTSDKIWALQGGVFIGGDNRDNSEIHIQPGTKIVGAAGADFLVITRGSKIFAEGSSEQPIVMTSIKTSNRRRGEWGGMIINGNAPINNCAPGARVCEAQGEGSTGLYGGNDSEDSSGVLRYVRVEWAGYPITPDNELNGIAFQGVGRGTEISYIQVHMASDDAVEFFGGTANAKYLVLTGTEDDSLDWTFGWTGKIQFLLAMKAPDSADNGVEADNSEFLHSATPRALPEISNATFVAPSGGKSGYGLLLRRGTGAKISNSIVTGFERACVNVADSETFAADQISITNSMVWCPNSKNFEKKSTDPVDLEQWFLSQSGNRIANPLLEGWMPRAGSPALGAGNPPLDLFFDYVDFIGGVDSSDDWTAGWTTSDVQ